MTRALRMARGWRRVAGALIPGELWVRFGGKIV